MSESKLESHEADHRERAKELFEQVGNWQLPGSSFLELAKLLKLLHWRLWEAGYGERLLQMQFEVSGRYDTPAYFATIHLSQTDHVSVEDLARCLEQECMRYIKPKGGWPEKPTKRQLKKEIDEEYLEGIQVHWLRMGRELMGNDQPPAPPDDSDESFVKNLPPDLPGSMRDIIDVVIEARVERRKNRLSRAEIGELLVEKKLGQGVSSLKSNLAQLSKRMGLLPYRSDTTPKGYGLPHWEK